LRYWRLSPKQISPAKLFIIEYWRLLLSGTGFPHWYEFSSSCPSSRH
jgi:hypothetical protein